MRHPSIQLELKYDGPSKYHSCDDINAPFSSFMIGEGRARHGRADAVGPRITTTILICIVAEKLKLLSVTLANCKLRIVVIGSGNRQQSLVLSFRLQFSSLGRRAKRDWDTGSYGG